MSSKSKLTKIEVERTVKDLTRSIQEQDELMEKFRSHIRSDPIRAEKLLLEDTKDHLGKVIRLRHVIKSWIEGKEAKEDVIRDKKDQLVQLKLDAEKRMEEFDKEAVKMRTAKHHHHHNNQTVEVELTEEERQDLEAQEWVRDVLHRIRERKEELEGELEISKNAKGSKNKSTLVAEVTTKIKGCSFHILHLELILRGLDNKIIGWEDCDAVRYDIDRFLDEEELDETVYEFLDLSSKLGTLGVQPSNATKQQQQQPMVVPKQQTKGKASINSPNVKSGAVTSATASPLSSSSSNTERPKPDEDAEKKFSDAHDDDHKESFLPSTSSIQSKQDRAMSDIPVISDVEFEQFIEQQKARERQQAQLMSNLNLGSAATQPSNGITVPSTTMNALPALPRDLSEHLLNPFTQAAAASSGSGTSRILSGLANQLSPSGVHQQSSSQDALQRYVEMQKHREEELKRQQPVDEPKLLEMMFNRATQSDRDLEVELSRQQQKLTEMYLTQQQRTVTEKTVSARDQQQQQLSQNPFLVQALVAGQQQQQQQQLWQQQQQQILHRSSNGGMSSSSFGSVFGGDLHQPFPLGSSSAALADSQQQRRLFEQQQQQTSQQQDRQYQLFLQEQEKQYQKHVQQQQQHRTTSGGPPLAPLAHIQQQQSFFPGATPTSRNSLLLSEDEQLLITLDASSLLETLRIEQSILDVVIKSALESGARSDLTQVQTGPFAINLHKNGIHADVRQRIVREVANRAMAMNKGGAMNSLPSSAPQSPYGIGLPLGGYQ